MTPARRGQQAMHGATNIDAPVDRMKSVIYKRRGGRIRKMGNMRSTALFAAAIQVNHLQLAKLNNAIAVP